jgi:hypothetical protein
VRTQTRHERVLIESNEVVAQKLRADPGRWYLVAEGGRDRARVFSQTAQRIKRGDLEDFQETPSGRFEATSTADRSRKDKIADAELFARFMPA